MPGTEHILTITVSTGDGLSVSDSVRFIAVNVPDDSGKYAVQKVSK